MTKGFHLDLEAMTEAMTAMSLALTVANAESQLAPVELRQELLSALWKAENLLVGVQDLYSRSESSWRSEEQEQLRERRRAERLLDSEPPDSEPEA